MLRKDLRVGATGFELATSTSRTKLHGDENAANRGAKQDAAERLHQWLHQWLHQIAESGERSVASVVADAVIESLGIDAVDRLVEAVQEKAEAVRR